jgi:hypothetical protein
MEKKAKSATRRFAPAGAAFALAGVGLFSYYVWKAGPADIWENISKIGAGFLLILALGGLRFLVRAWALTLCFERPHRVGVWAAFRAALVGDTAGNVLPLGLAVSEPTKAAMLRDRAPLGVAVAAITVENLFYMLSVALFIFGGATALLLSYQLPKRLRWSSEGIIAGAAVFVVFALVALWKQWRLASGALEWLAARGFGRRFVAARRERVRAVEDRIYGFYGRRRARFVPILLLESSFHALGVLEGFVTIYLISGAAPSLMMAFLFESVNRVITMVFKFVPLRAGVDEAGTGQLARVLAYGVTAGVTLAIVRKARMVFWMGVGVALLAARGLSLSAVAARAGDAGAEASDGTEDEADARVFPSPAGGDRGGLKDELRGPALSSRESFFRES